MFFRHNWSKVTDGPRLPCKVDHGKITPRKTAGQFLCSPRTWGWSGCELAARVRGHVLPTHVGMVRPSGVPMPTQPRAPHARGDGPTIRSPDADPAPCSPRTWGWSDRPGRARRAAHVLPTHVGMVRSCRPPCSEPPSAPHARGDGPAAIDGLVDARVVLPTHVGMVRGWGRTPRRRGRAPHARGDGPQWIGARPTRGSCSPRTWGWSGRGADRAGRAGVLPTHVGMVLDRDPARVPRLGAPHARGDGPPRPVAFRDALLCSPRTWGWSACRRRLRRSQPVLPTHVGMVRRTSPEKRRP